MNNFQTPTWAAPADNAELADVIFDAVCNGPSKYTEAQRMAWVPERRRPACEDDAQWLPDIERSSGEAFRQIEHLAWIADDDVQSTERHLELAAAIIVIVYRPISIQRLKTGRIR